MNDNYRKIEQISGEEVSSSLHNRIVRALFYRKYRFAFFSVCLLVSANLAISIWQAISHFIDSDAISVLRSLYESFEWSGSFASAALNDFFEVVPLSSVVSSVIGLAILAYLSTIYVSFIEMKKKVEFYQ